MSTLVPSTRDFQLTKDEEERRKDTVLERVRLGGKRLTTDIAHNLVDATIEYGMETSHQLNLVIFDPDDEILQWNQLKDGLRCAIRRSDIPGWDKFALVGVGKDSDNLTLTFEDESIWRMRNHRGFDKVARSQMTRAEFIYKMIREVTHPTIRFVSPQIFVRQPVAADRENAEFRDEQERDPLEGYGFSGDTVKVKQTVADSEQREVLKTVLDLGVKLKAPKTVLVAAVATVTEESSARNLPGGDRDSVGAFQQRAPWGSYESRHNVEESARRFYQGVPGITEGALKLYAKPANRGWAPWRLAHEVQHNYDTASKGEKSYGRWVPESRKTVDAYLGDDSRSYRGSADRTQRQRFQKYEFTRGDLEKGEAEDTWTAAKRLADEVGWRLYCYRGSVYYVSDDDLKRRPHKTRLTPRREGVINLSLNWDVGQPISEVTATVVAQRYHLPPGSVLLVRNMGEKVADVRWLMFNFRRSLFSQIAELTLHSPVFPSAEPAPEVESELINVDSGERVDDATGTVRARVVSIAKAQLGRAGTEIHYGRVRPIPPTLQGSSIITDCSGFATVVYREAGAPDPNGRGYDGQGFTGTLWSAGRAVNKPQPGDLVFYGNPSSENSHVAIVINGSEAIGHGSEGGPRRHMINYRSDLRGYRTYPLGD